MASAFRDNSASAVHIINLSVNAIEDKGTDAEFSLVWDQVFTCSLFFFCVHTLILWFLCFLELRCDCSQSKFGQIASWPQSAASLQGLYVPERCCIDLLLPFILFKMLLPTIVTRYIFWGQCSFGCHAIGVFNFFLSLPVAQAWAVWFKVFVKVHLSATLSPT